MRKSVVLLPSLRRREGLDGYVEGECMRHVAELARDTLLELPEYEAELFWPGYGAPGDAGAARRQQAQAETWLRARPGGHTGKIALALCSGAGPRSLVLGAYGGATEVQRRASRALAGDVAASVREALRARAVRVVAVTERPRDERASVQDQPFTAALVECGSHAVARDARVLNEAPEAVAEAVVLGIEGYFAARCAPAPGVVWRPGRLELPAPGAVARTAPSRDGRVMRALDPAVLVTDGYTEHGQPVAGSSRWYHLARACGYGWVHASAGRYSEGQGER